MNRSLAITHATVHPMDGRPALADHTVLVEAGRIVAVYPTGDADVDSGTANRFPTVLDAQGGHVLPGLADMHCHVGDAGELPVHLANGVTALRNMWGAPLHRDLARRQPDDGPGPYVATASPIVDGPIDGGPRYPGLTLLTDPADASALVAGYAAAGYRQVKVYSDLSPQCLAAVCAAAREHDLPVVGHCPRSMTYRDAITAGMTCLEHLAGIETLTAPPEKYAALPLAERYKAIARDLDREAVRRLAGQLAAAQVWTSPTLAVWGRIVDIGRDHAADPALAYVPTAARRLWSRSGLPTPSDPDKRAALATAVTENAARLREITAILAAEGAPLLLGTDAGSRYTVPGFAVHDELAEWTAAGLPAGVVLRIATAEAARFLGEDDTWGTVAPGRRADLLLVSDDPTLEPKTLRNPEAVVTSGHLLRRADLDAALAHRRATVDAVPDLPAEQLGPMSRPEWYSRAG